MTAAVDRLDPTMRMPRETPQVVLGIFVTEVVQKQEGIEFLGVAEAEGALQLDSRALDCCLGIEDLLDWPEAHRFSFLRHWMRHPRKSLK